MDDDQAKGSPWDVFIHLLAVIAIYASVAGALTMLFQFVNLGFPDPLDREVDVRERIREGVALLIIFLPAYVWAWRSIEKDLAQSPVKKHLWIRTCPIYLTLFLAGLLSLSDLACLVYYFLNGDLTSRFVCKVGAILVVAGAVLWFYLRTLRREPGPYPADMRYFSYAIAGGAALLIVAGIATAGSPRRAHQTRMDQKRIEDLRQIQQQVLTYWQSKAVLPRTLDDLKDVFGTYAPVRDPQTDKPYEYRVASDRSFELCADFALQDLNVDRTMSPWLPSRTGWNHRAGHVCFTRQIDPQRHPPYRYQQPRAVQ